MLRALSALVLSVGLAFVPALALGAPFPAAPILARLVPAEQPEDCRLLVENGQIRFPASITNPAMSCPDTFGWYLFIQTVADDFVPRWAGDAGTTFPEKPLALCSAERPENCCPADSFDGLALGVNAPAGMHCPWLPGNAQRDGVLELNLAPLSTAHFSPITDNVLADALAYAVGGTGRELRQEAVETVHRNAAMVGYIRENSLYYREGNAAVFERAQSFLTANMPFRPANVPGEPAVVDFPIDAVMGKAQWATAAQLLAVGVDVTKTGDWVTARMSDLVPGDLDPPPEAGETYYLLAFHISTKDTPNWVWLTFEHVELPGRCDYIGCIDRYGFVTETPEGAVSGYTPPATRNDGLANDSVIFALNAAYPGGPLNPELKAAFDAAGIGTGAHDAAVPLASDPAWLNYRLKGVQTDFVTSEGYPTLLANVVIEGGFVENSSCVTCHARATFDIKGGNALGVFDDTVNTLGYARSNYGAPVFSWFQASGTSRLLGVQTDFVWGLSFFPQPLWTGDE